MAAKYRFIEDPGHAWLEVPRAELVELGILEKVSQYSYQHGDMVYLEEDCDAGLFVDAKGLTRDNIIDVYQDRTPIRNYGRVIYRYEHEEAEAEDQMREVNSEYNRK